MDRRSFVGGLLSATGIVATAGLPEVLRAAPDVNGKRPNIVFFLVADLGWGDLHCYGDSFHEMPNIDRLARDGVKFTHAYAAGPVCSPSRCAIMTGQAPARTHVTQWIPGSELPNKT